MMTDAHYVDPTREAFDVFKSLPRDEPIHMLNLIKFREQAAYPDGHICANNGWSGQQAYREYGKTSGPIFARVGGKILWRGALQAVLIGPVNDTNWDASFIAFYPNSAAFLEMVTDAAYRLAVVHRQAAVLTSRLVRYQPEGEDGIFG
jgi:uncharacterized protein (DUF1330 family)